MSLVGPRPMIPSVLDELSSRDRMARARVKPGLTGPWQVSSAGGGALQDCAWLDGRYVENGSMAVDIRLLAMTASAILGETPPTPDELVDRLGWRSPQVIRLPVDTVATMGPELEAS
jgi:lipopolysaccharide/colanic/teichoic acid biosynthesis glycosyltransferase